MGKNHTEELVLFSYYLLITVELTYSEFSETCDQCCFIYKSESSEWYT